jgi:hypothetical protein
MTRPGNLNSILLGGFPVRRNKWLLKSQAPAGAVSNPGAMPILAKSCERSWRRGVIATAVILVALIPSAWLASESRDMPHLAALSDDGIYFVCAKSLAQGTGYRIISLPDQPFQTKYPPLFSWMLSLIWRINPSFPSNLWLASLFAWAQLPVLTVLTWLLFREIGPRILASAGFMRRARM